SPQIKTFSRIMRANNEAPQQIVQAESPESTELIPTVPPQPEPVAHEPSPTPEVTPAPTPSPIIKTPTRLDAFSTERDLYIKLYDDNNRQITSTDTQIRLHYPSGESYVFAADSDGAFYIVDLDGGEYSVDMLEHERYETAASITRTVKEKVEYKPIEDLEAIVYVNTLEELYTPEELQAEMPVTLVPEVIETPPEAIGTGQIIEEKPVVDDLGNQTYTYTFNTGPNGYLLLKGTQTESAVLPVDENNDGIIDYGMTLIQPSPTADNPNPSPYYVSEALFNSDNTPVDKYDIIATPVTEAHTRRVGWQNIDGSQYYFDSEGSTVKGLKEIDGKLHYFNQFGVKANSLGVDVSFYNEDIDWNAVKAQGVDFAIIRVGGRTWELGKLYYDSMAKEYLAEAQAAGLKIGVYVYATATTELEAVQEATLALEVVNGRSLDYPIFIDMEYSGMYPDGRADKLDMASRVAVLNAFCQTIQNGGYQAGVYSGEYFYRDNIDFNSISQYTIWLANYSSDNRLPGYANRYDMW
ncbi:MAG: hypothetical protein IJY72_09320, partial [Akkermansia sp.]|nr:hypothetical protein [Akkermansia sp.]